MTQDGATGDLPVVRIFVSSPGDVAEERAVTLGVIRRLQGWLQGRLVLVPIVWEQEPLLATAGFQQEIDRRAPPSSTDVAVFILWSRLGTPLSRDFELEDGRRPTGTEWEFEEAANAARDRGVPHLLVYRKGEAPDVKITDPHYERRRADWTQVQTFFERHFRDASDASFTGSYHEFEDASHFGQLLESHLVKLLTETAAGTAAAVTWHGTPFRGLEPFEAEHAQVFFGRTKAIQEVRRALARQVEAGRAFVLVLGRSGNGKSSLARAGVLPLLDGPWCVEPEIHSGFCRRAVLQPGSHRKPLESLAHALLAEEALPDLRDKGDAETLATLFAESPANLASDVRAALKRVDAPPPGRLLVLVDQLEELFTKEGVTDTDREAFAQALDALARNGDAYVLATLRSDFYPAFSRLGTLMALKEGAGHYDLPAVDAAETAQIVRGPAQVAGLAYEVDAERGRGLDDALIAAATEGPDALPLLEYALTQLEERKTDHRLTFAAYEAMGGLEGAIAKRAEDEWSALPDDARAAFPTVLRTLVEVVDGGATRRRAPLEEVASTPAAKALVSRFVAARLLVAHGDGEGAVVSVAHEALLRTWPRMADRIDTEAELLRIRSRVRAQAVRWTQEGRRGDLLLTSGKPLEEARLLHAAGYDLTRTEHDFVEASEARASRATWIKRAAVGAILALAACALVLAFVARGQTRQTEQALDRARAFGLAGASAERRSVDPEVALWFAVRAARTLEHPVTMRRLQEALDEARGRRVLRGHESYVVRAAFSPDGKRILTVSGDGTARIWDEEGTPPVVLEGHTATVWSATFSPDGGRVLTASADGTARIWQVDGTQLAELAHREAKSNVDALLGRETEVGVVAFSPDGRRLLTASSDARVRLWSEDGTLLDGRFAEGVTSVAVSPDGERIVTGAKDGTVRMRGWDGGVGAKLGGHADAVVLVVFSPDGEHVFTGSRDGGMRVWYANGEPTSFQLKGSTLVDCAAFSPNGRRLVTSARGEPPCRWDWESQTYTSLNGHLDDVASVAFSPDGRLILTASLDGTARLWDLEGEQIAVLRGHEAIHGDSVVTVQSAVFSPDGRRILTASSDGTARTWDVQGQDVTILEHHRDAVLRAIYSDDGERIVTASCDGTARLWNADGGEIAVLEGHTDEVFSATFSRDGQQIVTTSRDKTARLWSAEGKHVTTLEGHEGLVYGANFSPDGGSIVTSSRDGTARLWRADGEPVRTLEGHESRVLGAAFSPDGGLILTHSRDDTARLWNAESGETLQVLRGHEDGVTAAVFSADGEFVLTASEDSTARLWRTDGSMHRELKGHENDVITASFSPVGDLVLTASRDKTARLWERNGTLRHTLRGHEERIRSAAFSPDGRFVVTASEDGTARIWGTDGQLIAVLRGHGGELRSAVFSPDGRSVLTASDDGTARVWVHGRRALLQLAATRNSREPPPEIRARYGAFLDD